LPVASTQLPVEAGLSTGDSVLDAAVQNGELVSADALEQPQPAAKASASFPRVARLLKHSDFERVYKQGRRHFSSHMTVFYLRRTVDAASLPNGARVGFTVGRVLGGAVERNRIKRRLREAVRLRQTVLQSPIDVVINPKKSVLALEFSVVLDEVGRALEVIAKKMVTK
jgi:ribonuclease P protein component